MSQTYFLKPWNGVPVTEPEIQQWIQNGIHEMMHHQDQKTWYVRSGDTMVWLERTTSKDQEFDIIEYHVFRHVSSGIYNVISQQAYASYKVLMDERGIK